MENHDQHRQEHQEDELFDAAWKKSQENAVIESLQAGESLHDILESTRGFSQAFDHKLDCLDCSDGRICTGAKMGLAGAGVLLSPEQRETVMVAIKARGLTVSGHENCGAAKMAFPGSESDQYGYAKAEELARLSGVPYIEIHHDEFRSPIHNERSLVVDATGRFDCANWQEFPGQFISSAPALGLPDSYLKKEIPALTGIALSDHGFGERFTKENPFFIIISAKDYEQMVHLVTVAEQAAAEFGDRIRVEGFIAPEPERQEK